MIFLLPSPLAMPTIQENTKNAFVMKITRLNTENIWIPLALFGAAFSLNLSLISKGFYHTDCLGLAIQAQKILDTAQMHYLHLTGYPLTALLGALFLKIGPALGIANAAFSINMMSVVFSSLSGVLFYFFVKKICDPLTAALSTGLIITHPVFLATSVYGNSHMPALFFLMSAFLFLARYRQNGSIAPLVLSAVSLGLMTAARPQDIIILPAVAYLFLMKLPVREAPRSQRRRSSGMIKHGIAFLLATIVTVMLFYLPMLTQNRGPGHVPLSSSIIREVLGDLDTYALWVSFQSVMVSFSPWAAGLILGGIVLLIKKSRGILILLILWAAGPLLFFGSLITTVPRYYINIILPLAVIVARCVAFLIKKNRRLAILACLCYGALLVNSLTRVYPVLLFRHQHDLMKDLGVWVAARSEPTAIIFCQDERGIIEYFAKRKTRKPPFMKYASRVYTRRDAKKLNDSRIFIERQLQQGVPLYATGAALTSHDPEHRFLKMLKINFGVEEIGQTVAEEWHQGATNLILYRERLYRIAPR